MVIKQFGLRKLLLILSGVLFLVLDSKPIMHYIGVILQETSNPDDAKAQGAAFFILLFGVIPTVLFCVVAQVLFLLGLNSLLKRQLRGWVKFCAILSIAIPVLLLGFVNLVINDIIDLNGSELIIGVILLVVSFVLQLIVWNSERRQNSHCGESETKV